MDKKGFSKSKYSKTIGVAKRTCFSQIPAKLDFKGKIFSANLTHLNNWSRMALSLTGAMWGIHEYVQMTPMGYTTSDSTL